METVGTTCHLATLGNDWGVYTVYSSWTNVCKDGSAKQLNQIGGTQKATEGHAAFISASILCIEADINLNTLNNSYPNSLFNLLIILLKIRRKSWSKVRLAYM